MREREGEEGEEGILCVATKRGLLAAFLPPRIYHPLSYARLRWRCERLSCCRFSLSETGNRGLPLSRVCKTASGNTVRRRKPLRATRTPWNIVKRLGAPFLPFPTFFHFDLSRAMIIHSEPFRTLCTDYHLSAATPSPPSLPYPFSDLHRGMISTLTGEITHIAQMTMDVTRPVRYQYRVDTSFPVFNDKRTSCIFIHTDISARSIKKNFYFLIKKTLFFTIFYQLCFFTAWLKIKLNFLVTCNN